MILLSPFFIGPTEEYRQKNNSFKLNGMFFCFHHFYHALINKMVNIFQKDLVIYKKVDITMIQNHTFLLFYSSALLPDSLYNIKKIMAFHLNLFKWHKFWISPTGTREPCDYHFPPKNLSSITLEGTKRLYFPPKEVIF